MKYWRCLGQYDAESTTYSELAVAGFTSPFSVPKNGRLTGLRAIINRSAVTSLINHIEFRLSCTDWSPNVIEVGGQGGGIQTAPVSQPAPFDYDIDQPVVSGHTMTIEARNVTADTPVTVSAMLYGRFED